VRPDGIVLDLDDTLLDTTALLLPLADRRAAQALRRDGVDLGEDEIVARLAALRAAGCAEVFERLVREAGGAAAAADAAEDAWFDYEPPPLALEPDVASALDELASMAPLALLTSGRPETQRRKVARLGIGPRFAVLRFVDHRAAAGKTEALAEIVRETGWHARRTVMVGDRPDGDVRAGNRNGCVTVLVRRAGAEFAAVPPQTPDDVPWRTVAHVREIPALLRAAPEPD